MKKTNFYIFITVFTFVCSFSAVIKAQPVDITKIKDIPRYEELPVDAFLANTELIEDKPLNDEYLAYQVRLPKGWKKVGGTQSVTDDKTDDIYKFGLDNTKIESSGPPVVSRNVLGTLARYFGPAGVVASSRFDVMAIELDHEITARNWFLNHVQNNAYTLEGLKVYSNTRVEALYVLIERGETFIVRTMAEINGSRMVLASYYLPDKKWKAVRSIQDRVIQSFHFVSVQEAKVEPTETYFFLDLLQFDYPVSWDLFASNIRSLDNMEARLIYAPDGKTLKGEIEIHILSETLDLADEVTKIKEELFDRGLRVTKLIDRPNSYELYDHIFFSQVEVYDTENRTRGIQDHEYWLAIMAEDRYHYVVTMLTPARSVDFYTWARNSEAFETVIESLRP